MHGLGEGGYPPGQRPPSGWLYEAERVGRRRGGLWCLSSWLFWCVFFLGGVALFQLWAVFVVFRVCVLLCLLQFVFGCFEAWFLVCCVVLTKGMWFDAAPNEAVVVSRV